MTSKQVTWATSDGREVAITLVADYQINLSTYRRESGRKEVYIDSVTLDGRKEANIGIQKVSGHPTLVAKIGRLGITQDNLDRIHAAEAELEATIAQHNAQCDANEQELDQLRDEQEDFYRTMS